MKSLKIAAVAVLSLSAAACATSRGGYTYNTQQVYGSAQPAVSSEWTRKTTAMSIIFACPMDRCSDPGVIGYTANETPVNREMMVRRKILSAGLLEELSKSASHATNGRIGGMTVRDISNKHVAGFEASSNAVLRNGTRTYTVTRVVYSGRQGNYVTGVGLTPVKARRNLQLGIQGAR